jgi:hypothetical protein
MAQLLSFEANKGGKMEGRIRSTLALLKLILERALDSGDKAEIIRLETLIWKLRNASK